MSEHSKRPLNAEEIEALLLAARSGTPDNRADAVSDEPLGPGDVQYLRNSGIADDPYLNPDWFHDTVSTEAMLHQAEHHLAAAMSPEISPPAEALPLSPAPVPPRPAASAVPALGDIELDVTLELGRAELTIEDLLALREGSVVTLDKDAGEPIDLLANGKLIARGEVIVVDDKFCVRICEVIG